MLIFNPIEGADIVAVSIIFERGSSSEELEKSGIGFLSLRCGLKRSKSLSKRQVSRMLERFGSPLIPDVSHDFSSIVFQVVPDGIGCYLSVLKELLFESEFELEDFEVERNLLIASALSRYEDTFSYGMEKFIQFSFKGTPYQNIPYGIESSLSNISFEEIKNRYKDITSSFCIVSVAGKISDFVEREILDFSNLVNSSRKALRLFDAPINSVDEGRFYRKGAKQSLVLVGFEAEPVAHDNYLTLKLLNTIVGEGFNSLMFRELRERRGLAYSTGSFLISRRSTGRFVMYIFSSPEKESVAEREMFSLIERIPELIDGAALSRAKGFMEGISAIERELRLKRAWYPAWWEVMGRGYKFDETYIEMVNDISLEEVRSLASSLVSKPYHKVVISGE